MPTIYWAADSTVQYNDVRTYPQTGMGQVISLYLKPEIKVSNHAKNGRSTKSFIEESRLVSIYDEITEGDFLFIQFGHNDEKIADPARYTEPFGEYMLNLEKFINVARDKKANPILITPLERRCFNENGELLPGEHGRYVQAMKQVGEKWNVPVIDLCAMSRDALKKAGPEETKKWYMHVEKGVYPNRMDGLIDNTHLKYEGAVRFAGCIAKGLVSLGGIYADLLLDEMVFDW